MVQTLPLRPGLASPAFPCPDTHDARPAAGWCRGLEGAEGRVLPCHPAAKAQLGRGSVGTPGLQGERGSLRAVQAGSAGLPPWAGAQLLAPRAGHWGRRASPGWVWGFGAILTRHSLTLHVCSVSSSLLSCLRFRNLAAPRRVSREACRAAETGRWHRRPGDGTWGSLGRAGGGKGWGSKPWPQTPAGAPGKPLGTPVLGSLWPRTAAGLCWMRRGRCRKCPCPPSQLLPALWLQAGRGSEPSSGTREVGPQLRHIQRASPEPHCRPCHAGGRTGAGGSSARPFSSALCGC